jgi:hypothetical protein
MTLNVFTYPNKVCELFANFIDKPTEVQKDYISFT